MADETLPAPDPVPESTDRPIRVRGRRRRLLSAALAILLLLAIALIAGLARWIDTKAGHRFVAGKIAEFRPATGLRITVGGIEGSLYKHARLRDVRFYDDRGEFARIDDADLQWYPLAWFSNRLDIDWLRIGSAQMSRLPLFKVVAKSKSILPGFDIRLMDLRIGRLALGAAVSGKPHALQAKARVDIRAGRAVINLSAYSLDSADAVRLALDSRPDDRKFDIDAVASAPAGGIITGMIGVNEPLALAVRGNGSWTVWRGHLVVLRGPSVAASVAITAKEGHYSLRGPIALVGQLASLGKGSAALDAELTFDNRLLAGRANLATSAIKLNAQGGVDLGRNLFDDLRIDARIDDLARLQPSVTGRGVTLKARLAGPFDRAQLDALLMVPELRQGTIALTGLKLTGEGRLTKTGGAWPLKLSATALKTGMPELDTRLQQLRAEGLARFADGQLILDKTTLRTNGLSGRLDGKVALAGGALALNLSAGLNGLELHGVGLLDLTAALRVARPAKGALAVTGTAQAAMRRLDNAFLLGLGGGLPTVSSDLAFGGDGRLLLHNTHVVAPALSLGASGYRTPDGLFHLAGSGVHKAYGPVDVTLDGRIDRPRVDLTLARPGLGMRLTAVHATLVPTDQGFALAGSGQSVLGPFTAEGDILLPPGAPARIAFDRIRLSDVVATGTLTPVTGGLSGTLTVSGPADGTIQLSAAQGVQNIGLDLDLGSARFAGPIKLGVNRGSVRIDAAIRPEGTSITGQVQARGVSYGSVRIARLSGNAKLLDGVGTASLAISAANGRAFDLSAAADIAPDRFRVNLAGSIERQAIRLSSPADIVREGDGWRLRPMNLTLRGGSMRLSGFLGAESTHVEAQLAHLPLSLLDLANADLGLGGNADGTLFYDLPRGGVPSGQLNMTVHGLTRSGLALSSTPIDIGVNAALDNQRAALRAVIANGKTVIGRAQALLTPLGSGSLMERLNRAPLQAQVRYDGAADTLWRLTNIELLSLGGRLSLSAQAGGTLADPQISGTLAAQDASVQSPATGMTLSHVTASGSFTGDELRLADLKGDTAGGGKVAGTARFTFSGERGIGMDIALDAQRAVLLDRDDVGATVTGPLRIQSDGGTGTVSGNLDIVASRFMLGRAAAVAEIPQIRLIEINRQGDDVAPTRASEPWRLDITARAASGLKVEGLGMQSEWSADLKIGGTVTSPSFKGTATLIDGSYDFAGKRFDLREGRLTFTGSTPVNPVLDIRAVADVSDLNATINVTGTSLRPIVTMTSIPAMPQDELLSRLLFGTSITKLSAPEAIQLASAVAALQGGGGGLDPINAVRRATGLSRLRILAADPTTGQKTAIAAGKNIGRLYVELITDGQGYSATRIEFQITRWLALLSTVSSIGRQNVGARVSKDY